MEYMTVKDASEKWGYSEATIQKWCRKGDIIVEYKAEKKGGRWRIPADAVCPKPVKSRDGK